jgi:hypothetical protein
MAVLVETQVAAAVAYGTKILKMASPCRPRSLRSTSGKYILRISAAGDFMSSAARPPQTSEELRAAILDSYENLSKRLQQIARYVLDEPNAVALETLAVIGERAGVQPSAIVRFAKAIGFESASQMQKVIAREGGRPTFWRSLSKATCLR